MKPKILIVDDEPLNQATLEGFLGGDGYELFFAGNGLEACAQAKVVQPDLILLDVMMPEIDGFDVCRRIRSDPVIGRIPIIMITALDDDRSRLEGLRAGADDFLTKPCRREELRARVRTVASLNRFREIAEQRARFELLHRLSPSPILLVQADGTVLTANPAAETLLGEGAESPLAGGNLFGRFSGEAETALRRLVTAAHAGTPEAGRELRRTAGEVRQVLQVRASAVPEGSDRLVLLVLGDVTAEVAAREALEKMNTELDGMVRARTRQLEDANSLLMSYANFVSHDLRSPLTVMKGYLSMIQEGLVPLADSASLVEQAYNATLIMQELVQNILQLAQDEHDGANAQTIKIVEPTPIVSRLYRHLHSMFPHPARRFECANLPVVGVSPFVLERVFYNLIGNAIKYSDQREQPRVEIGCLADPAGPVLFVRDNGVGFDSRQADKLFREFSRLDTAGNADGFGLGLSLVARLVKGHGGRMWAEGVVGEGATFFVQFPPPGPMPDFGATSVVETKA